MHGAKLQALFWGWDVYIRVSCSEYRHMCGSMWPKDTSRHRTAILFVCFAIVGFKPWAASTLLSTPPCPPPQFFSWLLT